MSCHVCNHRGHVDSSPCNALGLDTGWGNPCTCMGDGRHGCYEAGLRTHGPYAPTDDPAFVRCATCGRRLALENG